MLYSHIHKHLCLAVAKKIDALAKRKGCEEVGKWRQSITNHIYWVVASTPTGQEELIGAKWGSLLDHVCNKHTHHENPLFPECLHEIVDDPEREKKWLTPRKFSYTLFIF